LGRTLRGTLIGTIILFAGNFAPRGWAYCQGQLLNIASNQALYAILGTTYGGNGQTTFALPDLRGRVPVGVGNAPGLGTFNLGEKAGTQSHTLTVNEMPQHNHTMHGELAAANKQTPQGTMLALTAPGTAIYADPNPAEDRTMAPGSIGQTGGNQPFSTRNPYTGLNYIIALEGIFPSRN
jgi:microcystin-dependent protein